MNSGAPGRLACRKGRTEPNDAQDALHGMRAAGLRLRGARVPAPPPPPSSIVRLRLRRRRPSAIVRPIAYPARSGAGSGLGGGLRRAADRSARGGRHSLGAASDALGSSASAPVRRRGLGRRTLDVVERGMGLGARALGPSARRRATSTRSPTTSTAVTWWCSSPASGARVPGVRAPAADRVHPGGRRSASCTSATRVPSVRTASSCRRLPVHNPASSSRRRWARHPPSCSALPPVVRPGMVVHPVSRGGVVEVVAPAGVTREGRPVTARAPVVSPRGRVGPPDRRRPPLPMRGMPTPAGSIASPPHRLHPRRRSTDRNGQTGGRRRSPARLPARDVTVAPPPAPGASRPSSRCSARGDGWERPATAGPGRRPVPRLAGGSCLRPAPPPAPAGRARPPSRCAETSVGRLAAHRAARRRRVEPAPGLPAPRRSSSPRRRRGPPTHASPIAPGWQRNEVRVDSGPPSP